MKVLFIDDIPITIQRKRVKNINLRVRRTDAAVNVSAPFYVSHSAIVDFVTSKSEWIRTARKEVETRPPAKKPQSYQNGSALWHLGREIRLEIVTDRQKKLVISKDTLKLHIPCNTSIEHIEKTILNWQRKQLFSLAIERVADWQNLIGVHCKELRIKRMKTKWGTCNIEKARVWLNLELIKYPHECIEYVIVHELVHLIERYHNANFYAHMDHYLPDWRLRKDQLNEMDL